MKRMDMGKIDDLTMQRVWTDISQAYREVIIQTPFYQRMMDDLEEGLGDSQRILDIGCGIGYLINQLLEDEERTMVGVDSNAHMLGIAKQDITAPSKLERVTLVQEDGTTYQSGEEFDAVVSSNFIFNVDDPVACLRNMYELIRDGGRLVLTSARKGADLTVLMKETELFFMQENRFTPEIFYHISVVRSVNERFRGEQDTNETAFKMYENEEIASLLVNEVGFSEILYTKNPYLEQNFLVVAKK